MKKRKRKKNNERGNEKRKITKEGMKEKNKMTEKKERRNERKKERKETERRLGFKQHKKGFCVCVENLHKTLNAIISNPLVYVQFSCQYLSNAFIKFYPHRD
jgi:hypothetical protein